MPRPSKVSQKREKIFQERTENQRSYEELGQQYGLTPQCIRAHCWNAARKKIAATKGPLSWREMRMEGRRLLHEKIPVWGPISGKLGCERLRKLLRNHCHKPLSLVAVLLGRESGHQPTIERVRQLYKCHGIKRRYTRGAVKFHAPPIFFAKLVKREDLRPLFEEYRDRPYKELKIRLHSVLGMTPDTHMIGRLYRHWAIARGKHWRRGSQHAALGHLLPDQATVRLLWEKHGGICGVAQALKATRDVLKLFLITKGWLPPPKRKPNYTGVLNREIPDQASFLRLMRRCRSIDNLGIKIKVPQIPLRAWICRHGWQTPRVCCYNRTKERIKRFLANEPELVDKLAPPGQDGERIELLLQRYPTGMALAKGLGVPKNTLFHWLKLGRRPSVPCLAELRKQSIVRLTYQVLSHPTLKKRLDAHAGKCLPRSAVFACLEELKTLSAIGKALSLTGASVSRLSKQQKIVWLLPTSEEAQARKAQVAALLTKNRNLSNPELAKILGVCPATAKRLKEEFLRKNLPLNAQP
ncbi:MAG: hypothetical protein PHV34_15075 [Verrucomicrobiae bacterium]|nr:hypothetical protein [Verrucomicrobiae bacterium]